jgi:hypothetical protein
VLVGAYVRGFSAAYHVGFGAGLVAMPDGKAAVPIALVKAAGDNYTALSMPNRGPLPFPAAVWTGKQYLLAIATRGSEAGPGKAFAGKDSVAVIGMDGKGKEIPGDPAFVVFNGERLNSAPSVSMAADDERCLLVEDVVSSKGRKNNADEELSYQVHGCFLSPDGKPSGDGKPFVIADAGKACASGGFASAGPKGQFLVVWSEARGIDDVKVLARIVKTK